MLFVFIFLYFCTFICFYYSNTTNMHKKDVSACFSAFTFCVLNNLMNIIQHNGWEQNAILKNIWIKHKWQLIASTRNVGNIWLAVWEKKN